MENEKKEQEKEQEKEHEKEPEKEQEENTQKKRKKITHEIQEKVQQEINEEVIEALLFISGRFMSTREIARIVQLDEQQIETFLENLAGKYSSSQSALTITSRGKNYKMDVGADYTYLINKLLSGESEFSKAEQETLAVIAHKQPIEQSTVIKIRGNKAYDHIKKFLSLNLLNSKRAGRTSILELSQDFYNYFSISTPLNPTAPSPSTNPNSETEGPSQEKKEINSQEPAPTN